MSIMFYTRTNKSKAGELNTQTFFDKQHPSTDDFLYSLNRLPDNALILYMLIRSLTCERTSPVGCVLRYSHFAEGMAWVVCNKQREYKLK